MDELRKRIEHLRQDYSKMSLDESMVDADPVKQFGAWFHAAAEAKVNEVNAMVLSTVNEDCRPSARVVLLRNFGPEGFVFYTNYNSRKGREIGQNPFASLTFFWPELERQVRIEGKLRKQTPEDSDSYFLSRPPGSQLGAWASPQSEIIADRHYLEQALDKVTREFEGKKMLRPEWWGGYVLEPDRVEFWQGRPSRLHDRIVYLKKDDTWEIVRLAP